MTLLNTLELPIIEDWQNLLYLFFVLSAFIFIRYLIMSGLYQKWVYEGIKKLSPQRIISHVKNKAQKNQEIYYSGIGSLIFGAVAVGILWMNQLDYLQLYEDINEYSLWYVPVSLFLAALLQETYYYWIHRAMHHPKLYKKIHLIHHKSVSTSVWTSFSFHPIEAVLQAVIIPIILLIVPMHIYVFLFFMLAMTVSAIINHAGVEIFPKSPKMRWFAKYFIGSTHHDQHHRKFNKNFGLYFTFWDRYMGTESADFMKEFEKHTLDPKES